MTAYARVSTGRVRQTIISDKVFPVIKNFNNGTQGTFLTVDATQVLGASFGKVRLYTAPDNVQFVDEDEYHSTVAFSGASTPNKKIVLDKTDEERIEEISTRFEMLDSMTKAMMARKIRGVVVSGPPGVGKSYGVERELSKMQMFTDLGATHKAEMVKGAMSPRGLYEKLYEFSDKGSVLVFDDCDTVLEDVQALNLLKAALDSSDARWLSWNSDRMGRKDKAEAPSKFKFQGSVMFITNVNFEKVKAPKIKPHLDALMSRCHYLDLTLNTMRDKILRVKQIAATGKLFNPAKYTLTEEEQNEILEFMYENKDKLREVSLRMALKIADCRILAETSDKDWTTFVRNTCMRD